MCVWQRRWGFVGGAEEKEAREIFGIVLDVGGEDDTCIVFRGAATGDGCGRFVGPGQDFADAAGGVFGGDALEVGMRGKEALALGQGHGMRGHGAYRVEGRARAANQVMLDGENGFGGDGEGAFKEEIVDADDWTGERIFDRGEESVGEAFADGTEGGVEGGARDRGNSFAEEADGGFFAEGTGLALEGDAHFMLICRVHVLASLLVRRNCGGVTGWAQERRDLARWAAPYDEMKMGRLQVGCGAAKLRRDPANKSIREIAQ